MDRDEDITGPEAEARRQEAELARRGLATSELTPGELEAIGREAGHPVAGSGARRMVDDVDSDEDVS